MSCFPCFSSHDKKGKKEHAIRSKVPKNSAKRAGTKKKHKASKTDKKREKSDSSCMRITAQNFTFRELASATKNFRQECLLGEGAFGRVYKATLQEGKQVVAIKQLDKNGVNGSEQFMSEVSMLSCLCHENLVNLIGYCVDGDQKLLVYEYFPGGSVEDHVLDNGPDKEPLDWIARMKIAYGAAKGLEYLHDTANPPIIYRDLKSSNILLDEDFNAKLSDFGLANLGPSGNKMHVTSRMMKTYGYCAPEYTRTGELTSKSDVYSFGVVLLELITGRRAIDTTRSSEEQNLVTWAQRKFRNPKLFPDMADPLLEKKFPEKDLNQAVAIAAMCLQEEASARPLMSDVATALSYLSQASNESLPPLLDPNNHFHVESNSDDSIEQDGELIQREDSNSSTQCYDEGLIIIEEIGNGYSESDENMPNGGEKSSYKNIISLVEFDSSRSKSNSSISNEGSVSVPLKVPVEYHDQVNHLRDNSGRTLDEMSIENGKISDIESSSTTPRTSQDSFNQQAVRLA